MTDLLGQIWTLVPYVRSKLFRAKVPPAQPWSTTLQDPDVGPVTLTGELREVEGADGLVIVLHGLGGNIDSYYCYRALNSFREAGLSSLALSLRGADRRGEDFYNIALTDDLHAAIASPQLEKYGSIYLVGYSMGGYVGLHLAREPRDERVKAVAAVCTPIDLLAAQRHIDSAIAKPYRTHVLNGLKSIYREVAARKSGTPAVPADVEAVQRVKTIYEWDTLTIAPRYGYDGPEHYYRELSIEPHLGSLKIPGLLIAAPRDPVVPPSSIEPFLGAARAPFELRWIKRGGHVAFPGDLDLGYGGDLGLEPQLISWFRSIG